jgi:hypothetical protein
MPLVVLPGGLCLQRYTDLRVLHVTSSTFIKSCAAACSGHGTTGS